MVDRSAVGVGIAAAFTLVWVNGAVIARFRPRGLARALFAAALAQALVGLVAMIAGFGSTGPAWPLGISMATGFFCALWLVSAWLFGKAAREQADANAESDR